MPGQKKLEMRTGGKSLPKGINRRKTGLREYGISKKRLKELSGFCEQYPEWKQELEMKDSTLRSPHLTGMPVSHNNIDITGDLAVRRVMLQEKCKLIEETAKEANEELYPFIIKSACYEVSIDYLLAYENIPCSRATFIDVRRYFFYLLDQKK